MLIPPCANYTSFLFLILFNTNLLHAQVNPGSTDYRQQCYGDYNDYFTDAIIPKTTGFKSCQAFYLMRGDLEGMTKEASGWVIKYNRI